MSWKYLKIICFWKLNINNVLMEYKNVKTMHQVHTASILAKWNHNFGINTLIIIIIIIIIII